MRRDRVCGVGRCLQSLRDTCDCGEKEWPRISEMEYDALQRFILDLSRCDAAAFSSNDARCLDFGLHVAMDFLGIELGPVLFGRVMMLSKAVRLERVGTFDFLTLRCSRLTDDERLYMEAVESARCGDQSRVASCAPRLVRNAHCLITTEALVALGAVCRSLDWFNRSPLLPAEEARVVH